jgi:large subunit ribosomal protein L13
VDKAMKTYMAKKEEVVHKWWLVDAQGQVLGRLASKIAHILQGKHKPTYTPHLDTGDFVVVINAEKIVLTGKKWTQKKYKHYSGYPGGLKEVPAEEVLKRKPTQLLRLAVRRMLPKTKLGRKMLTKFKIYAGGEHPHQAQKCEPLSLE